jgi:hypothetical protein
VTRRLRSAGAALVTFIGVGMLPPALTALLAAALAGARRAIAMRQARDLAVHQWLAGEVRLRGIRENAGALAAGNTGLISGPWATEVSSGPVGRPVTIGPGPADLAGSGRPAVRSCPGY